MDATVLEVVVKLLDRRARGVVLTAAGRVFLDHARLALLPVEAAVEGARRALASPSGYGPKCLHRVDVVRCSSGSRKINSAVTTSQSGQFETPTEEA